MARRGDAIYLRGKTWWLDFMHEGRRHCVRIGRQINRTVASEIATVKRAGILKGESGIGRRRKDLLFEKAKDQFLKWAEANRRPNTVASYRQCLAELARTFGGKRLGEIHPFTLEHYKRDRLAAGANVAPNRELDTLRALYNRCLEWGLYEGINPSGRQVKRLKESKGRVRFLEAEEEAQLLAAAKEPLKTIILLGIHAGLRIQSEACTLRRDHIDSKRGLITVEAAYAKSGQTRTIEMNSILRQALASHLERSGDVEYVFRGRGGKIYRDPRTAFENARDHAGLGKDVTPHVLRHTFASRLVMAGVDLRTVQELGGWSRLDMVQRYAHLSPSHRREAVERLVGKNSTTLFPTPALKEVTAGGAEVS